MLSLVHMSEETALWGGNLAIYWSMSHHLVVVVTNSARWHPTTLPPLQGHWPQWLFCTHNNHWSTFAPKTWAHNAIITNSLILVKHLRVSAKCSIDITCTCSMLSECQKGRVVKTTYQHFPLDGHPCQNALWVLLTPCQNSPVCVRMHRCTL